MPMDDPFGPLMDLWVQSAKAYTDCVQTLIQATGQVAQQSMAQTAQRLDAQTFSQLERMSRARWEEELRRLSELPFEVGERLEGADPQRLAGLCQSMVGEYLQDLKNINGAGIGIDLEPLTATWVKAVTGDDDDGSARRTIERLVKAMITKAELGPEHYAHPGDVEVGQSARELVHQVGKIQLFRYLPPEDSEPRRGDPVLLVYSIINKPFILDLVPGHSFIEHLLEQGLEVYLIEWGQTEPGDRETTLDSYIDPGIESCVQHIKRRTGAPAVSIFGHCIGGNLALLYAAQHPDEVSRLITLTTPGTAAKGGVVALWADKNLFPVDAIIDTFGHMPAKLIRYTFMAIKPYYEVIKWKMFLENVGTDGVMSLFYPVDRWANENVDIPGGVFQKFIVEVLHEDRFQRGETLINGRRADLRQITCPYLNLAASGDWIVVPDSAQVINDAVGSEDNRFNLIDGPHVAIMIDPRVRHHWTEMSDFLLEG
jgi:polyhydroxyalkanoate synthase